MAKERARARSGPLTGANHHHVGDAEAYFDHAEGQGVEFDSYVGENAPVFFDWFFAHKNEVVAQAVESLSPE